MYINLIKPNILKSRTIQPGFKLLRFFSFTSLLSIVIVAIAIELFYRQMAINTIKELGETSNLTVARTALSSIKSDLVSYLKTVTKVSNALSRESEKPSTLIDSIQELIIETNIVRIKIYNQQGIVVYSTKPEQIGRDQKNNPGFITAINGEVASKLIYHDNLNPFDQETTEDNLIQSYLPVSKGPSSDILGVFEIYTDVNHLVNRSEQTQLLILYVVLGIFTLLYVVLVVIVRQAGGLIDQQQSIIKERTQTLELLSAQLLTAQEDERKNIAIALHEEIAQTLSAVKLRLENSRSDNKDSGDDDVVKSVAPFIQDAIHETRSLAMRLRPSSLDDFGLLETLSWFFRDLHELFPKLKVRSDINAQEEDINRPLKTIIYRIVQDTLNNIANRTEADRVDIKLHRHKNSIELSIAENGINYQPVNEASSQVSLLNNVFAQMQERTYLSGGEFQIEKNSSGGNLGIARWPV